MDWRLTKLSTICGLALGLSGCGDLTSLDLSENLAVVMFGTFDAPEGAEGTADPKFQNYTLTGVTMAPADGSAAIDLFALAEAEATEVRIVSRSQIIFEASLSDYVDTAFSGISLTFAAAVSGDGPSEEGLTFSMTNPEITHSETFTVQKAKSKRLEVSILWKNTVTVDPDTGAETMAEPSYSTELVDD